MSSVEINHPIADSVFELPPPPQLSAAQIQAIVGRYQIALDELVEISRDQDTLHYQSNDSPPMAMTVISDTLFLVGRGHGMYNLIFSDPAGGRAETLTLIKGEDRRIGKRVD